ncbi:hypothetical protein BH09PLA1_BH09PLA1_06980 [soil metagenome]
MTGGLLGGIAPAMHPPRKSAKGSHADQACEECGSLANRGTGKIAMKIRTKLLLGMGVAFVLMLAGNYGVQQTVVMGDFRRLETEATQDDLTRCAEAVRRDLEHLEQFTRDWSSWDDAAKFVADGNPAFVESNLKDDSFKVSDFNLISFVALDGRVVWSGARDHDHETPIELAEFPTDHFRPDHPLLAGNRAESDKPQVSGILITEHGPLLVCARPILNSDSKWPAQGTLIMGRLISEELMQRYHAQTKVKFEVFPVRDANQNPVLRDAISKMPAANSVLLQERNEKITNAFCYLTDPQGKPCLIIQAAIPREISAQGRETIRVANASLILVAIGVGVVLAIMIRRLVIGPVEELASKAEEIGVSGDLSQGIGMNRSDEIGKFAAQFDKMVCALAESRTQFMALSRQAGMAEIATGVMHNIGNAVTNANVLAETLAEKVAQSKAPSLSKAVAMLNEHKDDLPRFFNEDGRGKKLPAFFEQLATHLNLEMVQTQTDLNALRDGLQHVKQIVAAQQDFAKSSTVIESIGLSGLAKQAITLVRGSSAKHGISVALDAPAERIVKCDRSKMQQVLVNLLSNAKDAIRDSDSTVREIQVCVGSTEGGKAFLEVRDSGMGIEADNLSRIFADGFTTKTDGHGHGLHYSATAIKEMGGTLSASSDGPGRGATFRIELPAEVMAATEVAQ